MSAGHQLKLDRAFERADALQHDIGRWSDKHQADAFRGERGPNPDQYRVTYLGAPDPPEPWSLDIGDCLYALRSSLDHLAFALAAAFTPAMTDAQRAGSEFPIFGARPMNAREKATKIGGMDPAAQTVIETLQPHLRGNDFASHLLWLLQELSNIDKHRLLLTTVGGHSGTGLGGTVSIRSGFMSGGSDKPGTVITDFIATAIPGHKMDMRLTTSLGIRFAEGPAKGREPVRTLLDIHDHIAKAIIPPLTPYL